MLATYEIDLPIENNIYCSTCGSYDRDEISITINLTTKTVELRHSYGCYNSVEHKDAAAAQYILDLIKGINPLQDPQSVTTLTQALNQIKALTGQADANQEDFYLYIEVGTENRNWNPISPTICHCNQTINKEEYGRPFICITGKIDVAKNKEELKVEEYCYHTNEYNTIYTQNSLNLKYLPQEIQTQNKPYHYENNY